MVITCPHCRKKHNVDENQIPAAVRKARCTACGNTFRLVLSKKKTGGTLSPKTKSAESGIRVLGISLSKGGVGKTTTAVNLAAGLAIGGYRVLLVDTDTQGQAGYMLGVKPRVGLTELVTGELSKDEVLFKARERLWLLAGGKSLAGVKRLIDRQNVNGERVLQNTLTPLEKDFDYVILDTSPGWDPLTVNVLFYVNEILTPVSLEVMTLHGLEAFLKSIEAIRRYRRDITLRHVLPTFLDQRVKQSVAMLDKLEGIYSSRLCAPIRYNIRLAEAPAHGKTIYEYAPGSSGAHDYRELVRTVSGNDRLFR